MMMVAVAVIMFMVVSEGMMGLYSKYSLYQYCIVFFKDVKL